MPYAQPEHFGSQYSEVGGDGGVGLMVTADDSADNNNIVIT